MAIPTPDNYPGVPGTTIYAGIAPPEDLRLITTTDILSTTGSTQTAVPVTFGQPFKVDDLNPTTESLYAKVDGVEVPVQMDSLTSFGNGSARFGVISASIPSLAGSGTKTVELLAGPKITPSSGSFNTDAWNPIIVLTIGGVTWTAAPRDQLLAQIASNTGVRLNGPIAKELRVSVPFKNTSNVEHTQLYAHLDVRLYSNGSIRTDLIIENGWLLVSSPVDITYSVSCTNGPGGPTIFTQASFTHYTRSRWHKVFWTGTESFVRPRHTKEYFLDSKITWNYDRTRTISSASLASLQSRVNASNTGPMGLCLLNPYMPGTGGREEIAPNPAWTAMYIMSNDVRAYDAMLKNADAGAGAPVHYRDKPTLLPVTVTAYPDISVEIGTSSPTVPMGSSSTPWTLDLAHQGSLHYIPYVITGDYFYLEEAMFWTTWNIAHNNPGLRGTTRDLIKEDQIRGQAWGLRSIAEMAFILPNSHPLKTYFNNALTNNMTWFNTTYGGSSNSLFSPLGAMISQYDNNMTPSYMCDFMVTVLGWLVENNVTNALSFLNSIGRMQIDRFLVGTQSAGFCTSQAAGSWLQTRNSANTAYITTWSEYYTRNYGSTSCSTTAPNTDPAYADWAGGYAAVARAALASASNAGATNAATAWTRWKTFTPLLDGTGARSFSEEPAYCIVPR